MLASELESRWAAITDFVFFYGPYSGAPITSYVVTASPGGAHVSGNASPLTITGLGNGTTYTFSATAANGNGSSSASATSANVKIGGW